MKKAVFITAVVLFAAPCAATVCGTTGNLMTVYNPFTNKLDYVCVYSSGTSGGGSSTTTVVAAWGSLYTDNGSVIQTGISTTPVKLSIFTNTGESSGAVPDATNDQIVISTTATYNITFVIYSTGTGVSNQKFWVGVNGATTTISCPDTPSVRCVQSRTMSLTAGSTVTVMGNSSVAGTTITVQSATLDVHTVGGSGGSSSGSSGGATVNVSPNSVLYSTGGTTISGDTGFQYDNSVSSISVSGKFKFDSGGFKTDSSGIYTFTNTTNPTLRVTNPTTSGSGANISKLFLNYYNSNVSSSDDMRIQAQDASSGIERGFQVYDNLDGSDCLFAGPNKLSFGSGCGSSAGAAITYNGFSLVTVSNPWIFSSSITLVGSSPGVMHVVAGSSNVVTGPVSLSTETYGVLPLANMVSSVTVAGNLVGSSNISVTPGSGITTFAITGTIPASNLASSVTVAGILVGTGPVTVTYGIGVTTITSTSGTNIYVSTGNMFTPLFAGQTKLPGSNSPFISNSTSELTAGIYFDDTSTQSVTWSFMAQNYNGGSVFAKIIYHSTATSGTINFGVYTATQTPNSLAVSQDSPVFSTVLTTSVIVNATSQQVSAALIQLSSIGLHQGDLVTVKLEREAGSNDSAVGFARVTEVDVYEAAGAVPTLVLGSTTFSGAVTFQGPVTFSSTTVGYFDLDFDAGEAKLPGSNSPYISASTVETSVSIYYDDTSTQSVTFAGLTKHYDGRPLYADIIFTSTATSGTINWGIYTDTETANVGQDNYDSPVFSVVVTTSVIMNSVSNSLQKATVTLSNTTTANGQIVIYKLEREAGSSDSAVGFGRVKKLRIYE